MLFQMFIFFYCRKMAQRFNRNDVRHAKHLVPEKIAFSIFSSDDIKNLSVIKIYTPLTFDALGHPLPGGLYDKCLGMLAFLCIKHFIVMFY